MTKTKQIQQFMLCGLGYMALAIAPLVLFFASVVHRYPFLDSISQSATVAGGTLDVLAICMGALAFFSFAYAKCVSYDRMDAVCAYIMAAGFTAVAAQPCSSPYLTAERVGVFGLTHGASNLVHGIGAVVGFGAMILWITFCFCKSDKPHERRTYEKHRRNSIYKFLGCCMIFCAAVFIAASTAVTIPHAVFFAEAFMLIPGGIACIIKSGRCGGHWLADKQAEPSPHPRQKQPANKHAHEINRVVIYPPYPAHRFKGHTANRFTLGILPLLAVPALYAILRL